MFWRNNFFEVNELQIVIIIIIIINIIIIIIIINHRVNSQCPIRYSQFLPAEELSGR